MDSSVSPKDEIWFLRVCSHISNAAYTQPLSADEYVAAQIHKQITDVTNVSLHVIKADEVEVQLHSISIPALGVGERSASRLAALSPASFEYEAGWAPERV
jgi:hypothetical protein